MKFFILILFFSLTANLKAEKDHHHHSEKSRPEGKKHAHEAGENGTGEHGAEEDHEKDLEENQGHEDRAHGEEHGEEEEFSSSVGPGNAVTAAEPKNGFQMSDEALKTLEIKTQPIPANDAFPKEAIVSFKDEAGVYRLRDGWFKLIEGETQPLGNRIRFTPHKKKDLRPGDQIVVQGVPLLRVTELDAFSSGEAGHGH
jgi:hypothetical protein